MVKVMVSIASSQRRRPEQGNETSAPRLVKTIALLRDVSFDGCGGWVQN